jgi:peptide/nickel transport system substrate-binding protein
VCATITGGSGIVRTFRFVVAASASALAVAAGLVVVAPTRGHADARQATTGPTTGRSVVIDVAGTAVTPAPEVPGARPGGTLHWLQEGSPEHFDPQQIYDALDLSTALFFRTLTGYIEGEGGLRVVGDLATNAGESSDGGRVWTFHLRPGIAFDDGSPIRSADIAYAVARSFSAYGAGGPHYLQLALDPSGTYAGPYGGGGPAPGVSTPDDRTIVFTFPVPHPEMPFISAMPTTSPVPQARDTGADYERTWVASGPYRRRSAVPGESLVLERNPYWSPSSDPIRHQYPDLVAFDWTVSRADQTARVRASVGEDAATVMTANVAPDQIAAVQADPALLARTLAGPTPTARYLNINTARVTDLTVRRALNLAFDRAGLVDALGGSAVASPSTTILAPTVPGYRSYDAYPAGPHGDPARARELLGGARPELTMCFPDTTDETGSANVTRDALQRAGFRITERPIHVDEYYTTIGTRGTTCDLMSTGWVADFPDGDSTLRVTLDGNLIGDSGNVNFSYLDNPAVNTALERLAAVTDRTAVAPAYGFADQLIMTLSAPLVPTFYVNAFSLYGSNVGGVFLSGLYGLPNITGAYVRT